MSFLPKQKRRNWDSKSEKGFFVGYGINAKGYRISMIRSGKAVTSRDVPFDGNVKGSSYIQEDPNKYYFFSDNVTHDDCENSICVDNNENYYYGEH